MFPLANMLENITGKCAHTKCEEDTEVMKDDGDRLRFAGGLHQSCRGNI